MLRLPERREPRDNDRPYEVPNLFNIVNGFVRTTVNHVNFDQPDTFIKDPAHPSAHAGVISNTPFGGTDLQRNFQFALKFKF